ncbi:MAG: TraX family protein [Prevotellaceae bacterium]|nr:TraX family protein [Prevotellaceae bacterium]
MFKVQCLSGSWIKIIALVSMFVDHYAHILLSDCKEAFAPLFSIGNTDVTLYFIMRTVIGRLAFPLFAFLVVEGYVHTKNVRKYVLSLLTFAVISIVPWNMMHHRPMLWLGSQNVLFTLCLGVVCLYAIEHLRYEKSILVVFSILVAEFFWRTDYGVVGVAIIVIMSLLRARRMYQCLALFCSFATRKFSFCSVFASIPIMLYNGKRGFIHGTLSKYLIYIFYPLHILILCMLA